jgi:hypothetical protein
VHTPVVDRARATTTTWRAPGGVVVVVTAAPRHARDAAAIVRALPAAAKRLGAHGLALPATTAPLHVVVHDDVAGFVRATGQTTATLRAWTTWDTVHLLPRDTWQRSDDDAVVARLTHEACHAALAQRHQDVDDARSHRPPRFVSEGVCSVVAEQAESRLGPDEVVARLEGGARVDFDENPTFSYAFAHHVFARLARCRGDEALFDVVDRTSAGERVEAVLGAAPSAWLQRCVDDVGANPGGDRRDAESAEASKDAKRPTGFSAP